MPQLTQLPWPDSGEIHIHCGHPAPPSIELLSPNEIRRADQFLDPAKRAQFIGCRSFLRTILAAYLELAPSQVSIITGTHGKPELGPPTGERGQLYFNVSHSEGLFLLAVGATHEVGVDCEMVHQDTPILDMAHLAFSISEQEELRALPEHLQSRAFYRCWTRKEAYLKGCGRGFSLPSNSFEVGVLRASPVTVPAAETGQLWHLHDLEAVPQGYLAALAVPVANPLIRWFRHP